MTLTPSLKSSLFVCISGHSIVQPGSASNRGLQQWADRAPATDPKVPVKALKGVLTAQVYFLMSNIILCLVGL